MTTKDMGYRMPAEWHPHSGTLLSWPYNRETWPGERLPRVEKVYIDIIRALFPHEPIHLLVNDEAVKARVLGLFKENGLPMDAVTFHVRTTNDVWARDFGPIFVLRQDDSSLRHASSAYGPHIQPNAPSALMADKWPKVAITDWGYNAWGGKYPPYDSDDAVPAYLAEQFGIRRFAPGMILEGGSIETNGNGVMLTTESVLLTPTRNPHLTKTDIEQRLKDYLGQDRVIWLKEGLAGDDTDGHIDDLSRFLTRNTIMTMMTDDPTDVNYRVLHENREILQDTGFDIIDIPMPLTRIEGTTVDGSEHVPASYANFYVANGVVLLPLYDKRHDGYVVDIFRQYFPDRIVVPIPCQDLVWGQGSIHCITQQLYGTSEF